MEEEEEPIGPELEEPPEDLDLEDLDLEDLDGEDAYPAEEEDEY